MKRVLITENELRDSGLKRDSLQYMVYSDLMAKLMEKRLVPGDVINRRLLAKELDVSVAPVLEALLLLEREGFVSSMPRKGTVVSTVRSEDVYGQMIVREALEAEAARLYCGAAVRENYQELIEYAQAMDALPTESLEHSRMEAVLHSSLVKLAGIDYLYQEFRRIIRIGFFYRINTMQGAFWTGRRSHVDLVNALCIDDPDRAEGVIRDYIMSGKPWAEEYLDVAEG